ncbi:MAG TPA: TIGR00730 family Rossman fold protein [Vicinamibacterales bacterium]|nr:TIGR00730 family Rossman fold protein [Vicinamibacterales bacterium]
MPDPVATPGPDVPEVVQPSEDDRYFLEGPHGRAKELLILVRAARDFIRGFRGLHFVGPCVTVFGSARFPAGHQYYELGREVGGALVSLGFTVMTGGGPGVMEAANRGAREAGGRSVGCNITLSHEQFPNQYLDRYVTCHYFFVRKVLLFKYSYAFVVLPGGLGTLDELTEALTLIQTGKIQQFPVVLMGLSYWKPFTDLLKEMVALGTVSATDLDLFLITDSIPEAMAHIDHHAIKRFGLTRRKGPPPSRLLWEEALRERSKAIVK